MIGRTNATSGSPIKIGEVTIKDKSADNSFALCDGREIKSGEIFNGLKPFLVMAGDIGTFVARGSQSNANEFMKFANGIFVAAGAFGKIRTSLDGIIWTDRVCGFGESFINGIEFGNGLFVIVGNHGKIATSINGITWTIRPSGMATTLGSLAFANNIFLMLAGSTVYRSINGINWTKTSTILGGILGGDKWFMDIKGCKKSSDGLNWASITSTNISTTMAKGSLGDMFFISDNYGKIYATFDLGVTWVITARMSSGPYGMSKAGETLYVMLSNSFSSTSDGKAFEPEKSTPKEFLTFASNGLIATAGDGLQAYSAEIEQIVKLPKYKTPTYIKYK